MAIARALLAAITLVASSCGGGQKPYGPMLDPAAENSSFWRRCESRGIVDGVPLQLLASDSHFKVTIGGRLGASDRQALGLRSISVSPYAPDDTCENAPADPRVRLRITRTDGATAWAEHAASRWSATDQALNAYVFCFDLVIDLSVRQLELVVAGHTVERIQRSTRPHVRAYASKLEPTIAIVYEDFQSRYATATMHLRDTNGQTCGGFPIAQKQSAAFPLFSSNCYSYFRGHFEDASEIDPAENHRWFFYSEGPHGTIVVSDLFYRFTFELPFSVRCW